MKIVGGYTTLILTPLIVSLQQEPSCPGEDPTPPPVPTPETTATPEPTATPIPITPAPRPDETLGLLSTLRVDVHGHPYQRDSSGEVYFDGGVALNTATTQNNFGGVLASVRTDPPNETAQGEAMLEVVSRYPHVIPLLWCLPGLDGRSETAETYLRDHQFAGLKFHPSLDGLPADSPLMDPYLEVAARYHVPVVIHTASDDPALPSRVETLAARHPDVGVVLYHSGLDTDHTEAIGVAKRCPNCYLETSWVPYADISMILSQIDSRHVIFGSDVSIDGENHYEGNWGSGAGDGSYDAQLISLGTALSRDDYRNFIINNTIRLFNLVTIHTYRPDADAVGLTFDNGSGVLGDSSPMVNEGNGWWRKMVPSDPAVRFRFQVKGTDPDGQIYSSHQWEVWQKDRSLIDAPAVSRIRVHASVDYGHGVFIRGSSWPLSWEVGEPMTWAPGNIWTLEIAGVVAPLEVKALIDDAQWEQGANHTLEPGETLDITPTF